MGIEQDIQVPSVIAISVWHHGLLVWSFDMLPCNWTLWHRRHHRCPTIRIESTSTRPFTPYHFYIVYIQVATDRKNSWNWLLTVAPEDTLPKKWGLKSISFKVNSRIADDSSHHEKTWPYFTTWPRHFSSKSGSFMTCFPSALDFVMSFPSTHRGVGLSELDDLWNQTYRRAQELCDQQIPRTKEFFGAKAVSRFCWAGDISSFESYELVS